MRNAYLLITFLSLSLPPALAQAQRGCPDVLFLGTQLDAVALNAAPASRTVTIGPTAQRSTHASEKCDVATYNKIVYDVSYDYTAAAGTISMTVTGGATAATATRSLTSCTPSAGNCTINMGGVATTASLSADTSWVIPVGTSNARVIKAVFEHGGTPTANEKTTVKVWLVK